jgi:hypothetical protein
LGEERLYLLGLGGSELKKCALDTDATPDLKGEHWLMHHGYA